jgi:thiol-disulfide isomerase/thioredoxin
MRFTPYQKILCARKVYPLFALSFAASFARAETVTFEPQVLPIGVREFGTRAQAATVSDVPPQRLEGYTDKGIVPQFAEISVGSRENKVKIAVIVDANNAQMSFYPDTSGAKSDFKTERYRDGNGREFVRLTGQIRFPVQSESGRYEYAISVDRPDPRDPRNAAIKDSIYYSTSLLMRGKITVGSKTYDAALNDTTATGDFRGTDGATSNVLLLIDRNGNGTFDKRGEAFDTRLPFQLDGTAYEITDMSASGKTFSLMKSDKPAPDVPAPPDLRAGKDALPFAVKTIDGKTVRFPQDYKGKRVLLYFWASWCGDCRRDLPHLLKAYKQFHSKGVEIVGVSLDRPNGLADLRKFLKQNGMTWAQIYDGKMWQTDLAYQYLISEIPAAFLVDGSTGKILAAGNDVLGTKLSETLKKP